ncbi:MAG: DUF4350 domain-containing protein [Kiritimatiellaeota bacterium]|nr:DUF4350 domain-containing protein [Kiritimatiellota bacterium]
MAKIILIAMAAALFLGIVEIFALRFSRGDLYPRYSSSRQDPFGCKALFESLREAGVDAGRIYKSINEISDPENTTIVRTGIHSFADPIDGKDIRDFILSGGCFIGFFAPDANADVEKSKKSKKKSEAKAKKQSDATCPTKPQKKDKKKKRQVRKKKNDSKKEIAENDIPKQFLFKFMKQIGCQLRAAKKKDDDSIIHRMASPTAKPAAAGVRKVQTFSRNYFVFSKKEKWNVLMECDGKPVLATRAFGKGSVTLCATSYPISNEGLAKCKNAELISLLIPTGRKILFDEHFLGIQETKNIAWLFKQYKLHLLLAVLALAAVFFIWSNMASISNISSVRANAYYDSGTLESGFSNADGLRDLIAKSVRKSELIDVCASEWLKTAKTRNIPKEDIDEIKDILRKHGKSDPVQVYAMISKTLNKRRLK